jgi:hypothetical protein
MNQIMEYIVPILLGVGGLGWISKDKILELIKGKVATGTPDIMSDLETLLEMRARYKSGDKVYTDLSNVINAILNPIVQEEVEPQDEK